MFKIAPTFLLLVVLLPLVKNQMITSPNSVMKESEAIPITLTKFVRYMSERLPDNPNFGPLDCGVSAYQIFTEKSSNRIVGGWEANPHSMPWQVYVKKSTGPKTFDACGGSLIQLAPGNGTDLVLTAAHCFETNGVYVSPEKVKILVGAHKRDSTTEIPLRVVPVRNYIHHDFKKDSKKNDLVLLKLTEKIPYTLFTRPICLPEQNTPIPTGQKCYVSGWGAAFEGASYSSPELKMTDVLIRDISECSYRDASMKNEILCAGYKEGGKDSCQGDSGGPLVCEIKGKWYQYGVVSYGTGCGRDMTPGTYMRVSSYIDWIKEAARKLESMPDAHGREEAFSPAVKFGGYRPGSIDLNKFKPSKLKRSNTFGGTPTTTTNAINSRPASTTTAYTRFDSPMGNTIRPMAPPTVQRQVYSRFGY